MSKHSTVKISTIGFAIFTMLFGAGNIIYPIKAGVLAGSKHSIGILGFLLTGVVLPILGLVGMILFEGNYPAFFARIGRVPGFFAIMFCMFIIGPFIVMPRCVTVPYAMLAPFMPSISLPVFSALFCLLTFALTYKESKMLDLLGKYMSPILIGSLGLIISLGLINSPQIAIEQLRPSSTIFFEQVLHGFQTLDLIGALFFAYIIIKLVKSNSAHEHISTKELAIMCLKGSALTTALMATFYIGFNLLGAYYAHLVSPDMNGADIFRIIASHIVGPQGVALLVIAILVTCLSTITALAAIFAEYLRNEIFDKHVSYVYCLIIGLGITTIISNFGLSKILAWGFPIITALYPLIVTITLCNIAYKLFNFSWVRIPVVLTAAVMIAMTLFPNILACVG
jgi:LIVCS family branched-chain amino acid:cation transporter